LRGRKRLSVAQFIVGQPVQSHCLIITLPANCLQNFVGDILTTPIRHVTTLYLRIAICLPANCSTNIFGRDKLTVPIIFNGTVSKTMHLRFGMTSHNIYATWFRPLELRERSMRQFHFDTNFFFHSSFRRTKEQYPSKNKTAEYPSIFFSIHQSSPFIHVFLVISYVPLHYLWFKELLTSLNNPRITRLTMTMCCPRAWFIVTVIYIRMPQWLHEVNLLLQDWSETAINIFHFLIYNCFEPSMFSTDSRFWFIIIWKMSKR